jgi:hypothetical protein
MKSVAYVGKGLIIIGGGVFVFGSSPTAGWLGALTLLSGIVLLCIHAMRDSSPNAGGDDACWSDGRDSGGDGDGR